MGNLLLKHHGFPLEHGFYVVSLRFLKFGRTPIRKPAIISLMKLCLSPNKIERAFNTKIPKY